MQSVIAANAHRMLYNAVDTAALLGAVNPNSTYVPAADAFDIAISNAWELSKEAARQRKGKWSQAQVPRWTK